LGRRHFLKGNKAPMPTSDVDAEERHAKLARTSDVGQRSSDSMAQKLQQHNNAVANSELRYEFMSGAGCSSFLLLDDEALDVLLKSFTSDLADLLGSSSASRETAATAAATRIPGVVDALTRATRGPSLLGAAPGECSSPAKAELRDSGSTEHDVGANAKRRKTTVTASPSDDASFVTSNSGFSRDVLEPSLKDAPTGASTGSKTREASSSSPSSGATAVGNVREARNCELHDDIIIDRRRLPKRPRQCTPHDDIQLDRWRLARRSQNVNASNMRRADVLENRFEKSTAADAVQAKAVCEMAPYESRTAKVPNAQDAPT